MSTNATLIAASEPSVASGASRHLPVLTLIIAGAAAVLSVFAIATDDVSAPTGTSVAVQQSATARPGRT